MGGLEVEGVVLELDAAVSEPTGRDIDALDVDRPAGIKDVAQRGAVTCLDSRPNLAVPLQGTE